MAQAEAFRRKKSLSDPSPWINHGWSASKLADPMEKKEMMRRLKDEWKKQDEERKTKLAIEKAKLDRARALEKMDETERQFWIEAHREELEEEDRERFDEFVKEQSDLKMLATEIREKRLEKAEAKIDAADEAARKENEYGRLEREKGAPVKEPQPEGEAPEGGAPEPAEPVKETVLEPVAEPAAEPVEEPAAEPVVEAPAAEPVAEVPAAEPANLLKGLGE